MFQNQLRYLAFSLIKFFRFRMLILFFFFLVGFVSLSFFSLFKAFLSFWSSFDAVHRPDIWVSLVVKRSPYGSIFPKMLAE
jgi:hypothetical protein